MPAFAWFWAASLALLGGPGAPASGPAPAPLRVASLNLCTDELLLLVAAPEQIVSVTHLAQQPAESALWRRAHAYPRNDGSLLSVTRHRPDLVLTMGGGGRDRIRIARRLGIETLDLPFATTLDDVEASVRRVAAALGRESAGEALLARMAEIRRTAPAARIDTIWLGGGGRTVSAQGLEAQWMALAGLRQRAIAGDRVSLETLLARPPAMVLRSDYRAGQYSGGERWLSHPVARRPNGARSVSTDGRLWTCMGPMLADEIARLRRDAR